MRVSALALLLVAVLLLVGHPPSAVTIPANALVNIVVEAYAPVGNGTYTTHVAAWKNTGLFLEEGDLFALTASGIAAPSPAGMAAGGFTPDGRGDAAATDGNWLAPYIDYGIYALVGKIGEDLGDEFRVGSSFSGVANDTGFLYLAFNDTHYSDNLGSWVASTEAVIPEPSTGLLLASDEVDWQRRE